MSETVDAREETGWAHANGNNGHDGFKGTRRAPFSIPISIGQVAGFLTLARPRGQQM